MKTQSKDLKNDIKIKDTDAKGLRKIRLTSQVDSLNLL